MKTNAQKIKTVKAVITTIKSTTSYEIGQISIKDVKKESFTVVCNVGHDDTFYATDIVALVNNTPLSAYLRVKDGEIILEVYTILMNED